MSQPTNHDPHDELLDTIASQLAAAELVSAERAWQEGIAMAAHHSRWWCLGIELAGWRGDAAALAERSVQGRAALSSAATRIALDAEPAWLARHRLALAHGQAELRLGRPRAALPLLGEALGQTEWYPDHPAASAALIAVAEVHVLGGAPRKGHAQLARAHERLATSTPQPGPAGSAAKRSIARLACLADVRLGRRTRAHAARRARRLATLERAAGAPLRALVLELEAALYADDARAYEAAVTVAERSEVRGAIGLSELLRGALVSAPTRR